MEPKKSYLDLMGPRFFIEMDGKSIEDLLPHIVSFEYKDNDKKADELSIHFSNKSLLWQDDPRFLKGTKIKTRWGYPGGDVSTVRQMTVVGVELSMNTDIPGIVLKAFDKRHEMSLKTSTKGRARNWGFKSSTDIARAIAKEHGLKFEGEDSKDARKEFRHQTANVNDVALLNNLADKLHWDFYVDGSTLHFHKKRLKSGVSDQNFEYTYFTDGRGTLLEFSTDLDLKKKAKTGQVGVDPKTGKVISAHADATTTEDQKTGQYSPIILSRGLIYREAPFFVPTAETNKSIVDKHTKAEKGDEELKGLEASITVVGTPKLQSKTMVKISGVGRTYSGNWRVTEARHIIKPSGQVYITTCDMKRNALSIGDKKGKVGTAGTAATKEQQRVTIFMDTGGITRFR